MSRIVEVLGTWVFTHPRTAVAGLTLCGLTLGLIAQMLGHYWWALILAMLGFSVSAGYVAGSFRCGKRT